MSNDTISMPSLQLRDFLVAFDLDRIDIKDINFYHENNELNIYVLLNSKIHFCPLCSSATTKIKSYRLKKIRHSIFNPVPSNIIYKARRYICPVCGKTFYENNPFVFNNLKVSVATVYNVLQELKRPEATFSFVASKYNLSPSSVSNLFDRCIDISPRLLPECLAFDETYAFKSEHSDYICVLLDYLSRNIVDILPSRRKRYLIDYFFYIPLSQRENVKYVSFDMWLTYRTVSKLMFPNCLCIVDKFHVLQDLSRRVSSVRISVMNKYKKTIDLLKAKQHLLKQNNLQLPPEDFDSLRKAEINYYLLKKFNFVLFSNNPKITDPNIEKKYNRFFKQYCNLYDIYDMIINIDNSLKEAVDIKDDVHYFYKKCSFDNAKTELENIIIKCRTSNSKPIQDFSNTLTQWKQEIINSFIRIPSINKTMNNALIENRNKTIKLLKHSSNDYTNWNRFRNRVLYVLNDDVSIKI